MSRHHHREEEQQEQETQEQETPAIEEQPESVEVAPSESFQSEEQQREAQKSAFDAAPQQLKDAVAGVNAFLKAMNECHAATPQLMLADTDVQQAAKRAISGLKVFSGETPVTFSQATSDADRNRGNVVSAVTGNTGNTPEAAEAHKV